MTLYKYIARWLLRLAPWRVLEWLTERYGLCWADVVSRKIYRPLWSDVDPWEDVLPRPTTTCFDSHPDPYDYCGHYGPEHPCHQECLRRRA